jgi:hypothetical protein
MKNVAVKVLAICVILFGFIGCSSAPNTTEEEKSAQQQQQTQGKKVFIYDFIHEATVEVNSQSFALLSMAKYRTYDSMPNYLKAVSDAKDVYMQSFLLVSLLGKCYNDGTITWYDKDEKTSIQSLIARLEKEKNTENAEMTDEYIKRLSLGIAHNIVIAAIDYLNFVVAVSNAESSFYDSTSKNYLSYDSTTGSFRTVTREEQIEFGAKYAAVKNKQYKDISDALLYQSRRLLKNLGSDLLLPVE